MRAWWLVLLLVPTAAAQGGPGVALLVYHPFPDDADPLGIDAGGRDPFMQRHARFDQDSDGFDFPAFVADGLVFVEGLPPRAPGEDGLQATRRVYDEAVQSRLGKEPAATLEVLSTHMDGQLRIVMQATLRGDASGDDLRAWYAIVEDPVHYQPPPALSNGVFDHPFVVRHAAALGAVGPAAEFRASWPAEQVEGLWVAFWVEQSGSHGSRFDPGEVVQAVFHPATSERTVQTTRAVLVEAYSASWCAPCLLGDRALEALAAEYGVARDEVRTPGTGLFQAPAWWVWIGVAVAAAVGARWRVSA